MSAYRRFSKTSGVSATKSNWIWSKAGMSGSPPERRRECLRAHDPDAIRRWGPDLDKVLLHFMEENPLLNAISVGATRTSS